MMIDDATLFFMLMATCLLVGMMLFLAWTRNRKEVAYLWWSAGFSVGAGGLGLISLRGGLPDQISVGLGTVLLLLGLGFCWAGARTFDHRPVVAWPVALGVLAWTAVYFVPGVQASPAARSAVVSTLIGFYSFAIAIEFWSGRREPLASRLPLAALCGLNGAVHFLRVATAWWEPQTSSTAGADLWFSMLLFQPALIMVAGGIYAIGLGRDRTETELRRSASVDSLTQVLNRGAVLEQAEAMLARARTEGSSLAVLLFDLDRFKDINDTLGHHAGDMVLQRFAKVASGCLRGSDIIGRLGGEEFAAILPGVGPASAHAVAERVRREFSRERIERDGVVIPATVSVGVVALQDHYVELDQLLSLADRALYEAKRAGRDQVRNAWALAS